MKNLEGKNIVFGITGSIAAYKTCDIISSLVKMGANITCVLTKSAKQFVTIKTLETITQKNVITQLFSKHKWDVEHVSLAGMADLLVVLPATANILAKFSYGIADDFLTTFFLTNQAPTLVAPAMNSRMYENKIVESNIARLRSYGVEFINPTIGLLACGEFGAGHLAANETIIKKICAKLT
ncbi:MAG: hypothetical protein GY817_05330 [bacterium]|nr:hypothetical protein [bacterium]